MMSLRVHVAVGLVVAMFSVAGAAGAVGPPNFVFILADDLGYMDIGANNPKTFYETPNIDRIAREGMRFTDGYAACPVCSPTRVSILTGRYPVRTGITDWISPAGTNQPQNWKRPTLLLPSPYADRLPHEEETIAEVLRRAGYATFFAGKWHMGPEGYWPEDQGFDINMGGCEWGSPRAGNRYFSPYGNPRLSDGPPGEHLPDRLAIETARFIEANRERPFLAYLSFYSVHVPLMAREDLRKKYEEKRKALRIDGPTFGTEGDNQVRLVQDHAVYAGMVEAMDQAIGKVLDALDRTGLAGNTVVFFTSDNGGLSTSERHPTSNMPLRGGKGWLYEGGIREPLLVRLPGLVRAGSTCGVPVLSTDFLPTILELAGVRTAGTRTWDQPHPQVDGVSFAPLLSGGRLERGPLYWHYPHYSNQGGAPGGAIRDGDWKLIEFFEDHHIELYNLHDDLGEHNNLAGKEPDRAAAMLAKLRAWQKELKVRFPGPRAHEPTSRSP